jgi:hypothetical protein
MRKTTLLLVATVLIFCSVHAQSGNDPKLVPGRTSFYAELGGPGILFSANIDRRFRPTHLGLGGRAGIGFVTANEYKYDPVTGYTNYDQASVITVPLQINYILGKANSPHTFEVGGGLTYVGRKLEFLDFYQDKQSKLFGSFAFMYRRQPVDGGFSWRIGFTPLVARGYIQPFGGVSVGYNF